MNLQEILNNANELIEEKDFHKAKNLINEYINNNPNEANTELQKTLGLCNINIDNYKEARNNFERVIEANNEDATALFYLGVIYETTNELQKAEEAYIRVIELRKDYKDAYKNLSVIYLKTKNIDKAIKAVSKAIEIDDEDYQSYYLLGTAYTSNKEYDKAVESLNKALEIKPDHALIYNNLGSCFLALKKIKEAQLAFEKSVDLNPDNATSFYNLATSFQLQQKHDNAYIHFQKAYEIDDSDFYLTAVALASVTASKWEDAVVYYQKLTALHPEKQNYQYNLACAYQETKQYSKAINILNQLVSLNPKSITMAHKLSNCYEVTEDLNRAKEVLENLLRLGKIPPEIYYKYALLCMKTDDKDKAETIFKKVIQLDPDNAQAHKDLGVVYLSQRLFEYAKEEFEIAAQKGQNDPLILFEVANYYYATKEHKKASEYYNKAYELAPDNIDINVFRALNYSQLNQLEKAIDLFSEALKKFPGQYLILQNLGLLYYKCGKYDVAKEFLYDAYSLYQDDETMNALALCFFENKEYENARNLAIKLIEKYPNNINILLLLAKTYIELTDYENSINYLEKIMEIFPEQPEAKELYLKIKGA